MKYVLVKWSADWADEFNTDGFLIATKEHWNQYIKNLQEKYQHVSIYFGTNEGWEDMPVKDYIFNCHVSDISDEEKSVLQSHFGLEYETIPYGIFPIKDECFPYDEDEND